MADESTSPAGQSRSIYAPNEVWNTIDSLADRLKWKKSKVIQELVNYLANGKTPQDAATILLQSSLGWEMNDPATEVERG